jgi:GNAT superfamily N-acetyltransferase
MAIAAVRPAAPQDVAEIIRIQRAVWRTAYTDLLPPAALDAIDSDEAEQAWLHTVRHGPARVVVASEGDATVGFCAAGPAPDTEVAAANGSLPADAARTGLVSALLVEPRWGRRGHGGRLLAAAAQALRELGAVRAVAWVLELDAASLGFYRRVGWEPDGTVRTLDADGRQLRELRMTGSLELNLVH